MSYLTVFLAGEFAANIVEALLHTLWQGAIIAAVLYLLLRRRGMTELRYAACVLAMGAVVICWLVTLAVLNYKPAFDEPIGTIAQPITVTKTISVSEPAIESRTPITRSPAISRNKPIHNTWTVWAMCGWLGGVVFMLSRTIWVLMGASRLKRQCRPIEDQRILSMVEQLRKAMRIGRRIRVAVGLHISVPGIVGCIWPTLLLPVSMLTGMPSDELRAILAHELAHIKRFDYLVNFLQMVVEAIFFFNPAVWWVSRQIRIEREVCCDATSVTATGNRLEYASVLAGWADRLCQGRGDTSAAAMTSFAGDGDSGIVERIRRIIVSGHRPQVRMSWHITVGMLLISVVLLSLLWHGTNLTVAFAGHILTPAERIEKMKEVAKTHGRQWREYDPNDKVWISGTVHTADGNEPPDHGSFIIKGFRQETSSSIRWGRITDGKFAGSIQYFDEFLLLFEAPDYAPLITEVFEPEPQERIENIDLILEKGFIARIQVVNEQGQALAGSQLSGLYYKATDGGWRGLCQMEEAVTDEDGIAVIKHCSDRPVKMTVQVEGYQTDEMRDVELRSDETFVWQLNRTVATKGIVVSHQTGLPIQGAEIRLCQKEKPSHGWEHGGMDGPVIATTDEYGEFELNTLDSEWSYTFAVGAEGFNSMILDKVKMGDPHLRAELIAELYVKGRIIGDLSKLKSMYDKPRLYWHCNYRSGENVSNDGWAQIEEKDGQGHFEIRDIIGDLLVIKAGDKHRYIERKELPIEDYVIDLRPGATHENLREVVLEFHVPEGSPPPQGQLNINFNSLEKREKRISGHSELHTIENSEIRLDVPVPGRVSYLMSWMRGEQLAGYWVERKTGIEVPEGNEPFVITVPMHPAGSIYGEVLDANGELAEDIKMDFITVEKSPSIERWHSMSEVFHQLGPRDGKFNAAPIPLDGKYVITARQGNTWIVSDEIDLSTEKPLHHIQLQFEEGVNIGGRIIGPDGGAFAGADVTLNVGIVFSNGRRWGTGGPKVVTNEQGLFSLKHVNPDPEVEYKLNVNGGPGYQPIQMRIEPQEAPVPIQLEQGHVLNGIVIDDATGWPVPGVTVFVSALEESDVVSNSLSADNETDQRGRFVFSNMAKKKYRFYTVAANYVGEHDARLGTGGQDETVVLRVELPKGSHLKARKPVGK